MKTKFVKFSLFIITASLLLTSCMSKSACQKAINNHILVYSIFNGNYEAIKELNEKGANISKLKTGRFFYRGSCDYAYFGITTNKKALVKFLVENGADINYKSFFGSSFLMNLSYNNDFDMCKFAIEHGANINYKDILGDSALEYLFVSRSDTEAEREEIMDLLLENGAKFRTKTVKKAFKGSNDNNDCYYRLIKKVLKTAKEKNVKYDIDPVLEAAITGDEKKMLDLINEGKMLPKYENQILFYTAGFGSVDTMKFLQKKGLDIFSLNSRGETTLMVASKYGNLDMVKYLVGQNVDLEVKSYAFDYDTAIIEAAQYNQTDVVKELIKDGAKINYKYNGDWPKSVLRVAAYSKSYDVVKFLIANPQLDENFKENLSGALLTSDIAMAKYLIKNGADAKNSCDSLQNACIMGYFELVKLLTENGTDIGNSEDVAPIRLSCEKPALDIVKCLVEHGADVNNTEVYTDGRKGDTPLTVEINHGCFDTIKYLVEHGADINYIKEGDDGNSILSLAAKSWSTNILKYFIDKGLDLNYQNYDGDTPLMLAVRSYDYDTVKLLVDSGADITLKNKDGMTALDVAKKVNEEGCLDNIINLLEEEK